MKKAAYKENFQKGSCARIVGRAKLEDFKTSWRYHHPLQDEQMSFADNRAEIVWVGFYHGGDVLYELAGVPGIWHEVCLEPCD
ncbi:MAG TPA: hypothetical protein PKD11_08200 [Pyrinomonadaceae bacterium]|nr:hypothetical protein [Pyrinomonadaceae bacterium]